MAALLIAGLSLTSEGSFTGMSNYTGRTLPGQFVSLRSVHAMAAVKEKDSRTSKGVGETAENMSLSEDGSTASSEPSAPDEDSDDPSKKADSVKLVTRYITDNGKKKKQFAVIKAFNEDGEKLWKYTTKKYSATGLKASTCKVKGDTVYIFEAGTLVELNKNTGEKIFRSKKKLINGYDVIFDTDDQGNIYAQGYYMNVLYKFDGKNGKTIWKKEIQKTGNYWPESMKFKNSQKTLRVVYKGGSVTRSGEHFIEFKTKSGEIQNSR